MTAELIEPDPRVRESYLAACRDSDAGWRGQLDLEALAVPRAFETYCRAWANCSFPWQHTEGGGRMRMFWWVEGDTWLGEATIRTTLPPQVGAEPEHWPPPGHVGYVIRESARRRGHGHQLFRAVVVEAHAMGINPVTVTVADQNTASLRLVEAAGAVLFMRHRGIRQYLV